MSLLKYLVFGAAVAAGVNYATKKRENGRSLLDDLSDKAPEWKEKAMQYADQLKGQYAQSTGSKDPADSIHTETPPY